MNKFRHAVSRQIITFGLLLAGCGVGEPQDEELDLELGGTPRAQAVSASLQDAFWAVGTLGVPGDPCPDLSAQDWVQLGDRMFQDATPGLAAQEVHPADLPDNLRAFCLYQWDGLAGAPILPVHASLQHVSLDWAVVEHLGNGLEGAWRPALRDVFMAQSGQVSPHAPQPTLPVTVAVVDSESEFGEGNPYIEHASAMVDIIEALACPSGEDSCLVDTYRALALPLLENGQIRHDGGYYGTRAHVAMGIFESVYAWKKSLEEEGEQSRLVINMSLGWVTEGDPGCGSGEAEPWCEAGGSHANDFDTFMSTPSPLGYSGQVANESVHAALLYATCQGALVVTSAGNGKEDSCNDTPMAPAVWARYASPSSEECSELGFDPAEGLTGNLFDADRPLVQAISAVDHNDAPIFLTRPESQTRLVAPGHMATTSETMDPLTGTSVSAAVVSAAAALQWSYDSTPSPGTVIERLYTTGIDVGTSSTLFEFGSGVQTDSRRVSLCRAVDPECTGDEECGGSYCQAQDMISSVVANLHTNVEGYLSQAVTLAASANGLVTDTCWSCGEQVTAMLPNTSSATDYYFFSSCEASPANHIPSEGSALAGPQPEVPPCPDCPLVASTQPNDSAAVLAIDSWYHNTNIQGVTLTLNRSGYPTHVMDLTDTPNLLPSLQSGATVRLTLPGIWHSANAPLRQASLGLLVNNGGDSHFRSNELLIIPPG